MFNKSRRTFIKGATYSSALALAGLSSLAMANNKSAHTQNIDTEIVTLINHTASAVSIDNISGTAISALNDENQVSIAAGEESSFIVPAMSSKSGSANNKNLFITDVLVGGQLAISSEYPEFNGIYPMTVFNKAA